MEGWGYNRVIRLVGAICVATGFGFGSGCSSNGDNTAGWAGPPGFMMSEDTAGADANPFPDDRFRTADGMAITVPSWIENRLVRVSATERAHEVMGQLFDYELPTLGGFGCYAPILFKVSAPIDEATIAGSVYLLRRPAGDAPGFVENPVLDSYTVRLRPRYYERERVVELWPELALEQQTTYQVVVTNGIRGVDGRELLPGKFTGKDAYSEAAAMLLGIDEDSIVASWSFTTMHASEELETARDMLTDFRESGHEGTDVGRLSIVNVYDKMHFPGQESSEHIEYFIEGYYCSPNYQGMSGVIDRAQIMSGEPAPCVDVPFFATIPKEEDGYAQPFTTLVTMHGLGADRRMYDMLVDKFADWGYATISIDAVSHGKRTDGLSMLDFFALESVFIIRDNLRQTAIDLMALVNALDRNNGFDFDGNGRPDMTSDYFDYIGVSMGGILGGIFTPLEPRLRSAVLNVPGGGITEITSGPVIGGMLNPLLSGHVELGVDTHEFRRFMDIFMPMLQFALDPADPINYARGWQLDPSEAAGRKGVLVQMGIGDAVVPNPTTRRLVLSAGLGDTWNQAAFNEAGAGGVWAWDPRDYGVMTGFMSHVIVVAIPEVTDQALRFLSSGGKVIAAESEL